MDLDQLPDPPAVPVVGPAEPWTPGRALDPFQDSDGRSDTPDPLRPSGTISIPCPRCKGGGTLQFERPEEEPVETPCRRCDGKPGGTAEVSWRTSERDLQSHVFQVIDDVAEGLCDHSVPFGLLVDRHAERACMDCTMLLVEFLGLFTANQQWRSA